ncbi:hypothetical protein AMATHDRAFT_87247 [Amanita thiersii Skay4041]|uniref:DUF6699 domain-containing protein n=1 Tax=Amanita thiersii Skay4041 TaxID=703135 RepID=A0A2A9NDV8_9AGAR|nr:hypothetical protein AMATHDRAFT_87247 [Amanita thiersii Skay4041]
MSSNSSNPPSPFFSQVGSSSSVSSVTAPGHHAPLMRSIPLPRTNSGSGGPTLHFLLGDASSTYYLYHVAYPINTIQLKQNVSFNDPATRENLPELRLRIFNFGLIFDVRNPRGVAVSDVLNAIHNNLRRPVSRDYYGAMSPAARSAADYAYQQRMKSGYALDKQMTLVDCLGKSYFHSLRPSPDGQFLDVLFI